ncbi:MAG: hypothetical protein NDJ90_11775 [Oligoflexia bacterium]|nr:hypothetical protein [Oligoflexia bacterium]
MIKDPGKEFSSGSETPDEAVQIKKYGNRRLYSSSEARFVTMEEIGALVRSGRKIRVTDANTEKDITAEILTQILLEGGRAQHFPVELLEQMIRLNEETLKGFWENYLHQSLNMFLGVQKEMEQFYKSLKNPFLAAWKNSSEPGDRDRERNKEESTKSAPPSSKSKKK